MRPDRLWFGLLLTGTALEAWALRGKRRDATLSHLTRSWLRTDTPLGRALFTTGLVWFHQHIINHKECP